MTIADKIISIAKSYLGHQEIPENQGFIDPAFQNEMESVGWYKGASWCAFLGKLTWLKAYAGTDTARLLEHLLTGNALETYHNLKNEGTFTMSDVPVPGGMCFFKEGLDPLKTTGHLTIAITGGRLFQDIGGNTNDGSDPNVRNGFTTAIKHRDADAPKTAHGLNFLGCAIPNEP